ncbi:unnamed protein product [Choristocarpus tenellus]
MGRRASLDQGNGGGGRGERREVHCQGCMPSRVMVIRKAVPNEGKLS